MLQKYQMYRTSLEEQLQKKKKKKVKGYLHSLSEKLQAL